MTLKARRFIFYSLVFLFIITGIGIVFYSQGWRAALNDKKIVFQKTGAIFIETAPKGVIIKIGNEVFKDKSGIIQSGTLINNLLPKNYKIQIEKEGYLPWRKNITVISGLVSEILKAVLLPEKLEKISIPLSKNISAFWMSSNGKIIFKDNIGLWAETQNSSPAKLRGDKFIAFSEDNNKIITVDSKNANYYLYEINNLSQTFNITAALNNLKKLTIKQIAFHPLDSNRLIIQNKNGLLYVLNLNRPNLENIVKDPILAWTIENANIYYIESQTNPDKTQTVTDSQRLSASSPRVSAVSLSSFNLLLKTDGFNFELPKHLINQKISDISVSGNKIAFLSENGGLYLFNQQGQDFQEIAHSAKNFAFSPDNKKIAFADKTCPVASQRDCFGDNKLNVYFIEDYIDGINKKAGEITSFNFYQKNGANIKDIYWYKDSFHLFVETQTNSMDFLEIDDREPVNKYTLLENAVNFNYKPNSNRLYFIEKNEVYFIEL